MPGRKAKVMNDMSSPTGNTGSDPKQAAPQGTRNAFLLCEMLRRIWYRLSHHFRQLRYAAGRFPYYGAEVQSLLPWNALLEYRIKRKESIRLRDETQSRGFLYAWKMLTKLMAVHWAIYVSFPGKNALLQP